MPKLTKAEVDEFLQERGHLARIATVNADGTPSVVPVWFICDDGKILITPRKYSAFYANIRRDPRVAITADEESGRYRKVLVEGQADILYTPGQDDIWRETYRRISRRYIDDQSSDYYITETIDQPRALIGVELTKAKVTTWQMPKEGEAYTGIWHKRYYEEGSKMRQQTEGSGAAASGSRLKIG